MKIDKIHSLITGMLYVTFLFGLIFGLALHEAFGLVAAVISLIALGYWIRNGPINRSKR